MARLTLLTTTLLGTCSTLGAKLRIAFTPAGDQPVRHVLRDSARYGDNPHANFARADEALKPVKSQDRLTVRLSAFAFHIDIKAGNDLEAFFFKALVGEQRRAEMADADKDDWLKLFAPQNLGNPVAQLPDIVPKAARAEMTEAGQVLAQLGGFDTRRQRERLARRGLHAVFRESIQTAQIYAQSVDRFFGNRDPHGSFANVSLAVVARKVKESSRGPHGVRSR